MIVITGPRQSGKTTLARSIFPDLPYLSMEMPQMRAFVEGDPSLFLERYGDGAVIDEAQVFPELFSWLQTHVDLSGRMGRFVLTGSQNLVLSRTVSQSLAGRAGLVQLLPLSCAELRAGGRLPDSLDEAVFLGGYPVVHARDVRVSDWFDGYLSSYIQ
ncbi:MAG: AAA family ATPase, partial [Burkholderiales bacterium]|nr:AAA family ATPase [Burkholderiales bacterium]